MKSDYIFVDNDHQLGEACAFLSVYPHIAIDTEFMCDKTYRKHIALVQLAAGNQVYLIDPLAIEAWQPFIDLLQAPSVTKVFHASSEDLEVIWQWLKVMPSPIMDTQIAYAFGNTDLSIGLQNMVQKLLGIHIDKEQSRSNWLQRPLTCEQKVYAANDVVYLLACAKLLQTQLQNTNKWDWFSQDMLALQHPPAMVRPECLYLKIKGIHKLSARQLLRVQYLTMWRETVAMKKDLPKSFIIKDSSLLEIAYANPVSIHALAMLEGLFKGTVKRYGFAIINVLEQANQLPETQAQVLFADLVQPMSKEEQKQFKQFKHCLQQVAKSRDILPQILAKKADLVELFETYRKGNEYTPPKAWHGFRQQMLDQPMFELFKSLRL